MKTPSIVSEICQTRILSLLLSSAICALCPSESWGGTYTVSNNSDSGAGSLRQAITDANAASDNAPSIIFNSNYTISLASSLPAILNNTSGSTTSPFAGGKTWTFTGNNSIIDGASANQAFFITPIPNAAAPDFDLTQSAASQTTPLNVTISNLTIQNCQAKGGDGDGGGLGAGGGVFVNSFADVTLDNVTLNANNATGGDGKIGVDPNGDGSGGGSLNTPHGGQGGDYTGIVGGNGDLGGAGGSYPGGSGGFGGGGGSGNIQGIGHPGGPGGFGGGGGAVATGINLAGGSGGFGGGGGAYGGNGTSVGTLGGFGGGGAVGYTPPVYSGTEPVGGGKAQSYSASGVVATGGGGAGLGGAIFVREKGIITLKNTCSLASNTVTGGTGSDQSAPISGAQSGSDLFFMSGVSNLNIHPGVNKTILFNGTIADDSIHSLPPGGNYVPSNTVGDGITLGDSTNQSTIIFAADNNSYGGTTTITPHTTLKIGNGGATGSLKSDGFYSGTQNIIDNGNLTFNRTIPTNFTRVITGTGSLTQAGTGTLTLAAANTYAGGTTVNAGTTLAISNPGSIASTGAVTADGTFDISQAASSPTIGDLSGASTGVVRLGNFNFSFGTSNSKTFAGSIQDGGIGGGIGGAITKQGAGTEIFTGTNTYTGTTTIAAGTLQLGNGVTNGTLGTGNVTDNGTLAFNQNSATTFSQNISGAGTLSQSGPGKVTLTGVNTYSGVTTIAAGTLQIGNGGANGSLGSGAITDNGNLTFDLSSNPIIGQTISGTGSLTQAGSGITTFTQANTFSGGTTITGGTLALSGSGSLFPTGTVTVGGSVNGTFDISGTTPSSTTIGDFWGTGTAHVNLGPKTLVFGAGTNTTYMGNIQGTGGLTKQGPGTFEISGVQSYTGPTAVNAGVFNLSTPNATLTSDVTVASGATLSGTGTINNLTSGGTVSPGYPGIGTITVNGALNLLSGGTYRADITPSNLAIGPSDSIVVNGAATLGGALTINPQSGTYNSTTRYTLVSATGGVTGVFSTITPVPGYKFKTYYNPNSMQIGINNNLFGVVSTGNPGRLAAYLDQIDSFIVPGSDLDNIMTILGGLSSDQLWNALDQIQPSLLLDTETTQELAIMGLFEGIFSNLHTHHAQQEFNYLMDRYSLDATDFSQDFMTLVTDTDFMTEEFSLKAKRQTRHKSQKTRRTKVPPITRKHKHVKRTQKKRNRSQSKETLLEQLPQNMRTNIGNMNLWIQQSGNYMKQNHNRDNVGFDGNSYMTAVGFDTKINRTFVVGVTGAVGQSNLDWNKDRGDAHITNYQLGLYGSWLPCQTRAYLDFASFVNRRRTSSKREISFPGYSSAAKQKHWGTDTSVGFKGGYFFQLPRKVTIEPFAQVGYTWMHDDHMKEHGASGINMTNRSRSNEFITSRIGAEFAYMYSYCDWMIRPAVRLGYAMYYRTKGKGSLTANIVDQPSFFVVTGAESKQNMFDGKLALTALHKGGFYVNAVYNADANNSLQYHTGTVQFGWRF